MGYPHEIRNSSIGTQIVTSLGISQHFRPQQRGHFLLHSICLPSFLQVNHGDTFCYTSSTSQTKIQLRFETILKPELRLYISELFFRIQQTICKC